MHGFILFWKICFSWFKFLKISILPHGGRYSILIKCFYFLFDTISTVIAFISLLWRLKLDLVLKSNIIWEFIRSIYVIWEFIKSVCGDNEIMSQKSIKVKLIDFKTNLKFSKFFLILLINRWKITVIKKTFRFFRKQIWCNLVLKMYI